MALGSATPSPGPGMIVSGSWLGPLSLTMAAAIWGGMYVVTKSLFAILPPWVLLDLRYWLALLPLGAIALLARQWRVARSDLPALALVALVGYVGSIGMQFWGTAYAGAAMGSLVTAASPALITLLAPLFLQERLTGKAVFAVCLATAGVVLAAGRPAGDMGGRSFLGTALLFGAALTWALYTLLGRRLTRRLGSLTVTTWVTALGAVFTLPFGLADWHASLAGVLVRPDVVGGVLFVAWVSTALAFFLWNFGFEHVRASLASLFFFAQPVVGGLLGWLLLGERLSWQFPAGGVVLLGAVFLSVRSLGAP